MIAVYPGSFDPVTSGHLDIIRRAAAMYDEVVVLAAVNSSKSPMFGIAERVEMLETACSDLNNVSVERLEKALLVDFAMARGAQVIVKGLRAVSDFEYEFQMAMLNRRLQPAVETVFLMAAGEHSFLSSSIVKEIGRLGGQIEGLVPDAVLPFLKQSFANV
ncbi:MAG: Phosphopantetheine adenylyltransferase [Capsulimonas sp.]|jgi:pantetheine-phosphate adenylyltransferase|nr:Phosphopantetheine adenylyltransferase [Capsulimonas sp.]